MPPRTPAGNPAETHEPAAFESDLDRHRAGDDEVYGSHGVQADTVAPPARPGRLRGRPLKRVGRDRI